MCLVYVLHKVHAHFLRSIQGIFPRSIAHFNVFIFYMSRIADVHFAFDILN